MNEGLEIRNDARNGLANLLAFVVIVIVKASEVGFLHNISINLPW
jgi:hypothetical protein